MNRNIPIAKPVLEKEDFFNAIKALKSGWISSRGIYIKKFEKEFKKYLGGGIPIAVSNGTVALELAIKSLGIKFGDEVIVPNFTFAATINAVINCGAKPIIVDVEKDIWTIDPNKIEKVITKKTKAVVLVHIYGQACRIDEIKKIAKKYRIFVIEDCAESIGATYKNRMVGLDGDFSCFSFYANKTITTGEGGMVLVKSKKFAKKAEIIKNHGMSKKQRYYHTCVGSNYRMTNIQAAIGLAQIKKIKKLLNLRKKIFLIYNNLLSNSLFEKIKHNNWSENSYWLYYVVIKKKVNIKKIINNLKKQGIEAIPTFYPLNLMKPYSKYAKGKFPYSQHIGLRGICLPSSGISLNNQKFIVNKLTKEVLKFK